jgi:glutaredoxin 3
LCSSSFSLCNRKPKVTMSASAAFIKEQISTRDTVVFSKSYCPYCRATKSLFKELGVDATVFELDQRDDGADIQAELATITGQRSVPNVFIKGHHVGGNDATQAANKSGKLKSLLEGDRA